MFTQANTYGYSDEQISLMNSALRQRVWFNGEDTNTAMSIIMERMSSTATLASLSEPVKQVTRQDWRSRYLA